MTGAVTAVVPSQVALLRCFSSSRCLACAPTRGAVAQRLSVMGRTDSLKHIAQEAGVGEKDMFLQHSVLRTLYL